MVFIFFLNVEISILECVCGSASLSGLDDIDGMGGEVENGARKRIYGVSTAKEMGTYNNWAKNQISNPTREKQVNILIPLGKRPCHDESHLTFALTCPTPEPNPCETA